MYIQKGVCTQVVQYGQKGSYQIATTVTAWGRKYKILSERKLKVIPSKDLFLTAYGTIYIHTQTWYVLKNKCVLHHAI